MKVSINLFGLRPSAYGPIVERADALGFHTVWIAEHLISPVEFDSSYPYREDGRAPYPIETPMSDVWALLANLAARTSRIRLGTGVYILPLRDPVVTARAVATVHDLANGRLAVGIGAGWLRAEFEAIGASFDDRGERLEEAVKAMRALWGEQPSQFRGRHFKIDPVYFAPRPQSHVPLLVGGNSPAARRRAAEFGDGWYGPACDLGDTIAACDDIERRRRRAGRSNLPFEYVVRLDAEPTPAVLRRYEDAGFNHVVAGLGGPASTERVERLADSLWNGDS